ncbi:winged helix-turn-helix domain-containing protein [Spirillospora sp. NPDC029432]|uniref:winged helix-turn-helix domain-containing protein n=1 Tax=Spirillospora sp. NPDC029432 TaxID=3154599 RepID=UPI0034540F08
MNGGPLSSRTDGQSVGEHSGRSPGLDDLLSGLNPEDPRSPSKQIAAQLRSAILAGHLKPDTRLPSQQQLSRRYGVARETVKAALRQLVAEDLISGRQGSRSVVRSRSDYEGRLPPPPSTPPKTFTRILDGISDAHEEAMSAIRSSLDLRQAFDYATQLIARSNAMTEAANELRNQTAIRVAEQAQHGNHTVRAPETQQEG